VGRYGAAALTIVGTIVGAYFGYPALGAALGSLAGNLLFPTKLPTVTGPRLSDLSQTTASVGVPIPEGWGVCGVPGTLIHYTRAREVIESDQVGGKGGPTQKVETPTYYSDFAISICDCPRRPIKGVRRIWANGKPIYDRRAQQAGETSAAFQSRMAANAQLDESMTVYLGTDTQEPDPTLEAYYGIGNVSAHLNLAYVMFTAWKHKNDDGNRIPAQWKFEYFTTGSVDADASIEYSNEVIYPWAQGDVIISARNDHQFIIISAGGADGHGASFSDLAEALEGCYVISPGIGDLHYIGAGKIGGVLGGEPQPTSHFSEFGAGTDPVLDDAAVAVLHYNPQEPTRYITKGYIDANAPGAGDCDDRIFISYQMDGGAEVTHTNAFRRFDVASTFQVTRAIPAASATPEGWYFQITDCPGPPSKYLGAWDTEIRAKRLTRAPDDPGDPQGLAPYPTVPGVDGFVVVDGVITRTGPWTLVSGAPQDYAVLARYVEGDSIDQYPLNPCIPATDPRYGSREFWEDQYAIARAVGDMPAGKVYDVDYPRKQAWAYRRQLNTTTHDTVPVSVAVIVEDLCADAGYDPEQIDTTGIADLFVIGYVRTRQMTARAAIDPLRQVRFFDGIESERSLKFVKRGGPVRHTFELDELGVFAKGSEAPSRISTEKAEETDLPRSVRIHYVSYSRDYEPGQQNSLSRTDTKAVKDEDVEVAIVMLDDDAKSVVQVLWADAWASRWTHEIRVGMAWKALQPTDCVAVPVDGETVRCRILDTLDNLPGVRTFSLVRDDDGNYVGVPVADAPPLIPPPLQITSPAQMVLLDIPLIRDQDNDAGFYAAMFPLISGSFQGAAIYRSTDGGGAFSRVASVGNMAYTGVLLSPLGAAGYSTIDGESEVFVRLDNGSLDSITRAALMNGGAGSNAAAVGADGRWELIQFQDVEVVDNRTFVLRTLLRGRRGTEHVIGSSEAGDRFVLLTGPGIVRVPLQLSDVGREYIYRAVGNGVTLDSADDVSFIGHAIALKPFSPVFLRARCNPTSRDWTVSWIRRGRIGQTMADGVDIPLSEAVEDYEVVVRSSEETELRVLSSDQPSCIYTGDQQLTDFDAHQSILRVEVYQVSEAVGRGYVASGVFDFTELASAGPGGVVQVLTVAFAGSYDSDQDATLYVEFRTTGGVTTSYRIVLDGDLFASNADLATSFASQVNTALAGQVETAVDGATVRVTSLVGRPTLAQTIYHTPHATVTNYQTYLAAQAGALSVQYVELYRPPPNSSTLAPLLDPAYGVNATCFKTFIVHAYDVVEETRISRIQLPPIDAGLEEGDRNTSGYPITLTWDETVSTTGQLQLLGDMVDAINASSEFAPYLAGAFLGQTSGVDGVMQRAAAVIEMAEGYYLAPDSGSGLPCGFVARLSPLQPGKADYPSGRPQIDAIVFDDAFDGTPGHAGYLSDLALGQTYIVDWGATHVTHVIDSTDMADTDTYPPSQTIHRRDRTYSSLATLIEAANPGFSVELSKLYRNALHTTTFTYQMVVTRTADPAGAGGVLASITPAYTLTITGTNTTE
jgi:hypothetical protein